VVEGRREMISEEENEFEIVIAHIRKKKKAYNRSKCC